MVTFQQMITLTATTIIIIIIIIIICAIKTIAFVLLTERLW